MQFNVVARIISGFVLMAVLLLVASIFSYVGLTSIRHSAESVVNEKMPVQQQMLTVQTEILKIGKHTLSGFHTLELSLLKESHAEFSTLKDEILANISSLNLQLQSSNVVGDYESAESAATDYINAAERMYQLRIDVLTKAISIQQQVSDIEVSADDYGAQLLDLSFLDGAETDQDMIALVGTASSIDNALQSLKKAAGDYIEIEDSAENRTVISDIEYAISVLDSQVNYLQQSSQGIDTDGIVDNFIEQFAELKNLFLSDEGLLQVQSSNVDTLAEAINYMNQSEQALDKSIVLFGTLFEAVNKSTLDGQNEIISNVHFNIFSGFGVLCFGLIAVVVIGYVIAKNISRPLDKIKSSLSIISEGDLTHKADDSSADEFGLLASKVNDLSASLHMVVEKILDQEHALKDATVVSVQLGEENIKQAALQFEQIGLTAENTAIVRQTSESNLQQIEQSSADLQNMNLEIKQVGDLIQQSQQQILGQAAQAKESAQTIDSLEQNSKNIGSILDVIKNIAEQTNLLALNAAIEAARAGEHGRGFAVVADEVRTLAIRTQSSTAEIEQMINTLQIDANQAVKAIELGQKETEQSVDLIDTVNQKIVQILKVVEVLADINENIVNESRDQDGLLDKVGQDLEMVVELAKQASSRTAKRNEVTQEMDNLMQQLSETVSKFKV